MMKMPALSTQSALLQRCGLSQTLKGRDDLNEYVIVMLDKSTIGNKIKLSIKARQKELDDLNNSRIYQEYNKVSQA